MDIQGIIEFAATISAIGGAWLTILKIGEKGRKASLLLTTQIIKEAKENDESLKQKLESKIEAIRAELKNLEFSVNKDIVHIKETQADQLKMLGDRIDVLREELQINHGNLVNLLTKLIDR